MKRIYAALPGIIVLGLILVTGCVPELASEVTESGDTVQVQYTGKLKDGTVFDSSVGKPPLEFTLGAGQIVPGFERAVLGMKVGESKTVTIAIEEAYGPHRDELVSTVSRDEFPEGLTPRVGQKFQTMGKDGAISTATITAVSETKLTLDANHPLAGKELVFNIKLVAIKEPAPAPLYDR